ncbi:AmpG family muropeptide MFS transporter [Pseudoxanthomonas wuyuanensis]|uniref:MFS transporter, PAT family, beta-lactamase induction signal transducer AmpG n=1 Tax=Pseudoxanthomonas wuyuanensis TaxID=1073196 RepID=A0A286D854_9GAMM|nr:MFS transporter [Pseudoxanthomonas wuyuanensis]KAF1715860.1 MFS transporter [Pseudoxanthomonas wuyuanensis]SOD54838.1 MFS transporter, PAT family, beta-lactamase induction signal transducer AmpG [Pseudoxanthomonas wuyuanensis]
MNQPADATPARRRKPWQEVLLNLRQPKVLVMLLLGFSSGVPIYLVGNTLGFWMRENGIELSMIGFLSWVGLAYSLKFLWAPLVDKLDAPLVGRWLGRRRGWMLWSQLVAGTALVGMALVEPREGQLLLVGFTLDQLLVFGALALVVAFASATQDIVIDAWRIEIADNNEQQGLLTSTAALGYRGALLVTDSLILIFAAGIGWVMSYHLMGALMAVGVLATFMAREPKATQLAAATDPKLFTPRGLFDALIGPFVAFFREHGQWALLMLLAISLYRLPDFVLGPMANPFYADLGIAKETVGAVRGSVGLVATIAGIAAAGLCAVRFGFIPTLLAGAVLGPGSNLAFAYLALHGADAGVFAATMVIDNFCSGFAGVALIGYMSSLTSIGYTATQYALLSSFYALLGKVLKGLSGVSVEYLAQGRTLLEGYSLFFTATALLGVPVLLLCLLLIWHDRKRMRVTAVT